MKKAITGLVALAAGVLGGVVHAEEVAAPVDEAPELRSFELEAFGYLRAGFEHVQNDERIDYIGENSGFVLQNARVGVRGGMQDVGLSFRLSVDAADTRERRLNDPLSELSVALRDAFLRQELHSTVGVQVGQFKAPFLQEELRATSSLAFASRAVGVDGVLPGRGFEEPGVGQGRQLGVMLSPADPIRFGDFGVSYALALMNGNGANRSVNDSNRYGLYGRLALHWDDMVSLGGSVMRNDRRVGTLPNRFDEEDFGLAGDFTFSAFNIDLFAQLAHLTTSFPTVGIEDRERFAWHVEAGYTVDALPIHFAPAYRFAHYHPRAGSEGQDESLDLDSFRLTYHTLGLRVWHPEVPLTAFLNYTLTMEEPERELDNNRLELLLHLQF